ncbi:MAG: glycerophosphodiester phosphodiesterase [Deltaproteobacteria bacterium]|nr:glycerophosphodiester phosphodiesterase [Candidatus Zymogenaceae bacterium]
MSKKHASKKTIPMKSFFGLPRPIIFAHRGASGTYPENTLPSFQAAVQIGAHVLETDTRITRDGIPVLAHDPSLLRTAGVDVHVEDLTLKELKDLDAGYSFSPDNGSTHPFRGTGVQVPTLEEFVQTFQDIPVNMEIKAGTEQSTKIVLDVLESNNALDRFLLASFPPDAMRYIQRERPTTLTGACKEDVLRVLVRSARCDRKIRDYPFTALQVPERQSIIPVVTRRFLSYAHRYGVHVHVWTINEESDMRRLFDMGVDGIFTDHPERALAVLEERRTA